MTGQPGGSGSHRGGGVEVEVEVQLGRWRIQGRGHTVQQQAYHTRVCGCKYSARGTSVGCREHERQEVTRRHLSGMLGAGKTTDKVPPTPLRSGSQPEYPLNNIYGPLPKPAWSVVGPKGIGDRHPRLPAAVRKSRIPIPANHCLILILLIIISTTTSIDRLVGPPTCLACLPNTHQTKCV
jgi:hypothetical protein